MMWLWDKIIHGSTLFKAVWLIMVAAWFYGVSALIAFIRNPHAKREP